MDDNITTIAALQLHIDELEETNAQMVAFIAAFEAWLVEDMEETLQFTAVGEFHEDMLLQAKETTEKYNELKAKHLGTEVE